MSHPAATEHECSLRVSALCTPPTSGKPKRRACPRCGGVFSVREGTYAVVPWRGDGRYTLEDAISTHRSRSVANRAAIAAGEQYVERFLSV